MQLPARPALVAGRHPLAAASAGHQPGQQGRAITHRAYRHGIPVAFIDWDAAQPVEPLADLAAAAWTFVPLAPPGQLAEAGFEPLPDLAARLRMFLVAYGLTDRTAILPALEYCVLDEPEPLHWLQGISPDLARAL
jgi:hypothetical protein